MRERRLLWRLFVSYLWITVVALSVISLYDSQMLRRFCFQQVDRGVWLLG
jgi:hypothetical protein